MPESLDRTSSQGSLKPAFSVIFVDAMADWARDDPENNKSMMLRVETPEGYPPAHRLAYRIFSRLYNSERPIPSVAEFKTTFDGQPINRAASTLGLKPGEWVGVAWVLADIARLGRYSFSGNLRGDANLPESTEFGHPVASMGVIFNRPQNFGEIFIQHQIIDGISPAVDLGQLRAGQGDSDAAEILRKIEREDENWVITTANIRRTPVNKVEFTDYSIQAVEGGRDRITAVNRRRLSVFFERVCYSDEQGHTYLKVGALPLP